MQQRLQSKHPPAWSPRPSRSPGARSIHDRERDVLRFCRAPAGVWCTPEGPGARLGLPRQEMYIIPKMRQNLTMGPQDTGHRVRKWPEKPVTSAGSRGPNKSQQRTIRQDAWYWLTGVLGTRKCLGHLKPWPQHLSFSHLPKLAQGGAPFDQRLVSSESLQWLSMPRSS